MTDLIEIVGLSRVGRKCIEDELSDCLEDSGITEWVPPAWTLGSKLGLAKRSVRRHADTVAEFNAKLLAATKDDDKAAYIRYPLAFSSTPELECERCDLAGKCCAGPSSSSIPA